MNIFKLLEIGVELGASDIHITVDSPPIARVKGNSIYIIIKSIFCNYFSFNI